MTTFTDHRGGESIKEGDTYHAFILSQGKMYDGMATRAGQSNADGWHVSLNTIQHPLVNQEKLVSEMQNVLVDFSKKYIPLDGE